MAGDVRRLPRARRAASGSPTRSAAQRRGARRAAALVRPDARRRTRSSTRSRVHVPGRAPRSWPRARERGHQLLWRVDDDDRRRLGRRDDDATRRSTAARAAARRARRRGADERSAPTPASRASRRRSPRTSSYLEHAVFNTHRSETAMMRYLKYLADKDYALDRGMIPLGSCTMKLNAATEMAAVTWPEFAGIHPFAPEADVEGYLDADRAARGLARRGHRLRRGVAAAERRIAGRARRAARDPRLPPRERRHRALGVPHPVERARHQRRQRRARRHEGRRRRVRRARQRRPRRPARQGRRARRRPRRAHGHLPVDARRVRARDPRDHAMPCTTPAGRSTSTARTSTPCSATPASATSAATSRTSTCTRRSASRTAAAAPASGRSRRRRTSRRSCPGIRSRSAAAPSNIVSAAPVRQPQHPADLAGRTCG